MEVSREAMVPEKLKTSDLSAGREPPRKVAVEPEVDRVAPEARLTETPAEKRSTMVHEPAARPLLVTAPKPRNDDSSRRPLCTE